MTVYFFDSSGLTKRYLTEIGTSWVRQTVLPSAGNRILIAEITPVEIMSAVSRQKRDQHITERTARAIRLLVGRHASREYDVVLLSYDILQRAQDLLDKYPLRAYDAVQLASALDSDGRLKIARLAPLVFVCADTRLLTAATGEGLQTHHPI